MLSQAESHRATFVEVMPSRTDLLSCVWLFVYAVSQFEVFVEVMLFRTERLLCEWPVSPPPPPPASHASMRSAVMVSRTERLLCVWLFV